jgi:hypothetical protein
LNIRDLFGHRMQAAVTATFATITEIDISVRRTGAEKKWRGRISAAPGG